MKTLERTIERPRVARAPESETRRRSAILPIAAVVAALLGLLAGFLVWGTDETDSTAPVVVGGVELTLRQEQMIELLDDYEAAWQVGDGGAAAAMFTENGVLTIFGDDISDIADGISRAPQPTLDVYEPVLVSESMVISFHDVEPYGLLVDVFEFTTEGELLLVRHEVIG